MAWFPTGKIRLWVGQPVNAPFVTPPLSLRVFSIFCYVSVTGFLVFAVASRIRIADTYMPPAYVTIAITLVHFVLPILAAYTISTNRPISRLLVLVYACALSYQAIVRLDTVAISAEARMALTGLVAFTLAGSVWWLYRSQKLRVYYAMILDKEVPDDLVVAEVLAPSRFEAWLSRVGELVSPWLEALVVVIVLGSIVVTLFITF